jgi:hypothetical protein
MHAITSTTFVVTRQRDLRASRTPLRGRCGWCGGRRRRYFIDPMLRPIQLHRLMRRHGRVVLALAAALAALALLATAHALDGGSGSAHHGGHAGGHTTDAVSLCLATGACVLAVVGTAVAVRRLLQRGSWPLGAALLPAMPVIRAPAGVVARAGPPRPVLQVFRL